MMTLIEVPGEPKPQGSMYGFKTKTGGIAMRSANPGTMSWRLDVATSARKIWGDRAPVGGPVEIYVRFYLPRPKYHYDKDGAIKAQFAAEHHVKAPDLDKLMRAIGDGLKAGGVYRDDSQIHASDGSKCYVQDGWMGARIQVVTDERTIDQLV
jgi:Holliday junction resolvase RusA-like endonuclease